MNKRADANKEYLAERVGRQAKAATDFIEASSMV